MTKPRVKAHADWRYGFVELPDRQERVSKRSRRSMPTAEPKKSALGRRGVALVAVITSIAILAVFVAELLETTTTELHIATAERDRVKAEYLAKSGVNLTRLLIAREPEIRKVVAPFYQLLAGRPPPQINIWAFADTLLAPFEDLNNAKSMVESTGVDFGMMEGIKDTGGTFEVIGVPENGKLNLNAPLFLSGTEAARSTAMLLFGLLGGYTSPDSPYDPMFSQRDADGQFTTRLDIVSDVIDWWDYDQQRTVFDPGSNTVANGGGEDDVYGQFRDPYVVKNAPFDSLQELRLIRGVGDDFWATFVEPNGDDPRDRLITIYASGIVNVNEAEPQVLLARLCSYVSNQILCNSLPQAQAFIQLFRTVKSVMPLALFTTPKDFIDFMTGGAGGSRDLYTALLGFLGKDNPLMAWTPMQISPDQRVQIEQKFLTEASIFTIQSTAHVGKAQAKVSVVVNFDKPWVPPPGAAGSLPALGVLHHYRID